MEFLVSMEGGWMSLGQDGEKVSGLLTQWSDGNLFRLGGFWRVCCWRGRRLGKGIGLLGCLGRRRRGFLRLEYA